MADIKFAELDLKKDASVNSFDWNGQTIEVKKYLPIEDKYDLIMITLQNAYENGLYNCVRIELFFNLYIIYMYTNLEFSDEEKADSSVLYDALKSNGIIDAVIANMDDEEYEFLYDSINQIIMEAYQYKNSAAGILSELITDLPKNAEAAAQIVDNFDPAKYQAVVDFVQAANGGRPVSGPNKNQEIL